MFNKDVIKKNPNDSQQRNRERLQRESPAGGGATCNYQPQYF